MRGHHPPVPFTHTNRRTTITEALLSQLDAVTKELITSGTLLREAEEKRARERAEQEQQARELLIKVHGIGQTRAIELVQRSSGHMYCMCSEERNFECPGGLWRPAIGSLALLASQ